jgi:hypothetical protein
MNGLLYWIIAEFGDGHFRKQTELAAAGGRAVDA